jgi:hypothetical protein
VLALEGTLGHTGCLSLAASGWYMLLAGSQHDKLHSQLQESFALMPPESSTQNAI